MARFRSVPHSLSRHRDQSIESARRLFLLPPAGQPLQHCGFPGINTCLKHMRDKKIMPGPNNKCLQTKLPFQSKFISKTYYNADRVRSPRGFPGIFYTSLKYPETESISSKKTRIKKQSSLEDRLCDFSGVRGRCLVVIGRGSLLVR